MGNNFWNQVKSKYRLGEIICGRVERHFPFGILVDIGDKNVRGIVQIPDFVDMVDMTDDCCWLQS